MCVKYFLLFVLKLPYATFIKCPLVFCIWGENEEKFPVLSIPLRMRYACHDIWCHIPLQSLFFQADVFLSPQSQLIQKLLSYFPLKQSFTPPFPILLYTFRDGKGWNMPQNSRSSYIMNMSYLAKEVFQMHGSMGMLGYKVCAPLYTSFYTAL